MRGENGFLHSAGVLLEVGMIMWKRGSLCLDGKFTLRIIALLVLLLVMLPLAVCKSLLAPDIMRNPLPILHKYFQPGGLLVGCITSQVLMPTEQNTYDVHPHNSLIGDIM